MAATERDEIELDGGPVLHRLSNEDRLYGHVLILSDGEAQIWIQTGPYTYRPTDVTFPGFVSAARACIRGDV